MYVYIYICTVRSLYVIINVILYIYICVYITIYHYISLYITIHIYIYISLYTYTHVLSSIIHFSACSKSICHAARRPSLKAFLAALVTLTAPMMAHTVWMKPKLVSRPYCTAMSTPAGRQGDGGLGDIINVVKTIIAIIG